MLVPSGSWRATQGHGVGDRPRYIAGSISLGPGLPPAEPRKMPQPLPYVGSEQNSGSPVETQGHIVPIR